MIRSQVVVLKVFYDEGEPEVYPKAPPAEWNWADLVDEPINPSVEVLAAGPIVDYPRPGEEVVGTFWVGKVNPGTKPFDFQPEPYDTLAAAEARIAAIEKMDPVGVERGDYYIDTPEEV